MSYSPLYGPLPCPRCKLRHDLYDDRPRFDKTTARAWFQTATGPNALPVHPSVKVRVCEALTEEKLGGEQ